MAINFPDSPTDGQAYADSGTGQTWTYELATNSWTASSLAVTGGVVYKGSVDITAAPPTGAKAGEQWSIGTGGTANAGYGPGVTGTITKGGMVMYTGSDWLEVSHSIPDATAVEKGIDTLKWNRTGTVLSPANAGDDVNIGGTKIALKADGSGTFAGGITSGADQVLAPGSMNVYQAARSSTAVVYNGGWDSGSGRNITSTIYSDGSAQFASDVKIGGTLPASPKVSLKADGSASYSGKVEVGDFSTDGMRLNSNGALQLVRSDGTKSALLVNIGTTRTLDCIADGTVQIGGTLPGTPNISLKADGSATFASDVKIGGTLPAAPKISLNASSGGINFDGILTGNFTDFYAPLGNITKAAFLRGDTVLFTGQNGNNYYGHFDTAGDLKIGGTTGAHKISLNADGSAMFTGGVTTSTRFTGTSVAISAPGAAGNKTAWISASNSAAFYVSDDDNGGATTVTIGWNGSATFAGNTTIGPFNLGSTAASGFHFVKQGLQYVQRPASSPNEPVYQAFKGTTNTITLTCDGSASFAGAISSNRSAGNVWEGYQSSSITSQINANGSATFAGDVSVGGNPNVKLFATGLVEVGNPTASATVWGGFIPGGNYTSRILADGSATYAGTVTATVVPPSDARFKENITPANPQLADVVALGKQLKNFDWNDKAPLNDELRSVRQLGLIAQEAEKVCPGLIKTIQRTKQGEELTPEEIIPAVVEPAYTIPAVTEEIPDPDNEGEVLTVEVTPAQEVPERVVTPEKVIPATYEELDDSYKGISTDVLIMKLLGAVAELQDQINTLKNA